MQRYIVFIPREDPYFTEWMSDELFPEKEGSVVFDTHGWRFTRDGVHWDFAEEDHL